MHRTVSFPHLNMAVILGVWLCTQITSPVVAQDRVRAKVGVGIQASPGAPMAAAKAVETVKAGYSLRVYVVPEHDAYLYVVHNDGKTLTLLNAQNATTKISGGGPVTLPGPDRFYQIDGGSDR